MTPTIAERIVTRSWASGPSQSDLAFTEFALNFNMELGLLVRRGAVPARVQRHFDALMNAGQFVRL